jgi:hypothetical protein
VRADGTLSGRAGRAQRRASRGDPEARRERAATPARRGQRRDGAHGPGGRSRRSTSASASSWRPSAAASAPTGARARDRRGSARRRTDRGDVDAGDAVDERVVGLADDREPVARQALDEPDLPQRLAAVELLGEQPAGEPPELVVAARGGQPRVAQVVAEVEVRVVDPDRAALLERDARQPLAVARDEVQARLQRVEQVVVLGRLALERHDRGDMHVRAGVLDVEEGGVERGEAVGVAGHRA